MQENISLQSLREFAPAVCPALVFRPVDMGSPQQDWARHLADNPLHRRELEEFAVLGDTVVRFADGVEPEPIEKVKLLSLSFAVNALGDETDAMEFVRCVKAIASPDAGQFELEQIAAHYLREIRRRGSVSEVLKEMGMLGLHLRSVTSLIAEREIECFERDASDELKLTVADQRRAREIARAQPSLPDPSPNFDEELSFIEKKIRRSSATRLGTNDFADFYLSDDGKSIDELDADYAAYSRLEQYDENGLIGGASLDDGRRVVVMFDFPAEIDASYLPESARPLLAGEMLQLFVGHKLGGVAAACARREMLADKFIPVVDPGCLKDSERPFSDAEFEEWLGMKLDALYPRRTLRTVRRLAVDMQGRSFEFESAVEVNPEFEEMSYVAAVCRRIWANFRADFHLRSLRREVYQETHRAIRATTDTADLAQVKKRAYSLFKEEGALTLKEFTALNTAARSQEARLSSVVSRLAAQTLSDIGKASANRLRFLKFHLYNDARIAALTRQEKQRLWDAVRAREAALAGAETVKVSVRPGEARGIQSASVLKTTVRVYPRSA